MCSGFLITPELLEFLLLYFGNPGISKVYHSHYLLTLDICLAAGFLLLEFDSLLLPIEGFQGEHERMGP